MPQAFYTVDFVEGVWKIGVNGRMFGPYSSRETAIAAAVKAGHKAEAEGFEVVLKVLGGEAAEAAAEADRDAA